MTSEIKTILGNHTRGQENRFAGLAATILLFIDITFEILYALATTPRVKASDLELRNLGTEFRSQTVAFFLAFLISRFNMSCSVPLRVLRGENPN